MLDHILATAQIFEREHGIAPNIIYLNTTHFETLLSLYPTLSGNAADGNATTETGIPLGMQLVVVTDTMLMHPHAAYLPGASHTVPQQSRSPFTPEKIATG